MFGLSDLLKKYWPIKNFSQKLSDKSVEAFQSETADEFYDQLQRVHKRIMDKPDIQRKA